MELTLQRKPSGPKATLGDLFIDGVHECVTLEDVVRRDPNPTTPANEAKVYGETAIPAGRYRVVIDLSQRFGRMMLHILDVPGYSGIRIHSGNRSSQTLGCPLVGQEVMGPDYVWGGSKALPVLQAKVQAALDQGEGVWITIKEAPCR